MKDFSYNISLFFSPSTIDHDSKLAFASEIVNLFAMLQQRD